MTHKVTVSTEYLDPDDQSMPIEKKDTKPGYRYGQQVYAHRERESLYFDVKADSLVFAATSLVSSCNGLVKFIEMCVYARQNIPVQLDQGALKYTHVEKDLSLIGFADDDQVCRQYWMGESYVVMPAQVRIQY